MCGGGAFQIFEIGQFHPMVNASGSSIALYSYMQCNNYAGPLTPYTYRGSYLSIFGTVGHCNCGQELSGGS